MKSRFPVLPIFAIAITMSVGTSAWADLILQPTGVSTDMGQFGPFTTPAFTIDQSGLSPGYTSQVTDFDTYFAGNPTHNFNAGNSQWVSDDIPTGNFDFDLGGSFVIESFALWNDVSTDAVQDFTLLADDNSAFSSAVVLGSFTASGTGDFNARLPQTFGFTPTEASFVRMQITSNYDQTPNESFTPTSFGEAAFKGQAIPEPSSLVLLATAMLVGAGLIRRR